MRTGRRSTAFASSDLAGSLSAVPHGRYLTVVIEGVYILKRDGIRLDIGLSLGLDRANVISSDSAIC